MQNNIDYNLYAKRAAELFKQGYNCSQSVFGAYAEELGLDLSLALKISSGLGGGMGRLREVCGAVSGGILALGIKYGYDDFRDYEAKAKLYGIVQDFAKEFKAEYGTYICRELLNTNDSSAKPTPRTEEFYKSRPCIEYIKYSAYILEKYIKRCSL